MANPILDSPITTRIVLGFLKFLSFAQSAFAPDQKEKIESIKESLKDVFRIDPAMLMVEVTSMVNVSSSSNSLNSSELAEKEDDINTTEGSSTHIDLPGMLLFQEFSMVVAQTEFYYPSAIGQNHLPREPYTKQIFNDAIELLTKGGYETSNRWNLADALNTLGNHAMRDLCYGKAIDMYACAVALWKNNPMYFCNRGAAFTMAGRFWDATYDLYEAIRLEPRYVLAYYRLGCAYFQSGKNLEAIYEGFIKALQLDPNNEDALISLQRAENKMREEASRVREQICRILNPKGKRPFAKRVRISTTEGEGPSEDKGRKGKRMSW